MKDRFNIGVAIDDCKKIIEDLKCVEYDMNNFHHKFIQLGADLESCMFIDKVENEVVKITKIEEFFECIVKFLERTQETMNEMDKEDQKERAELFK